LRFSTSEFPESRERVTCAAPSTGIADKDPAFDEARNVAQRRIAQGEFLTAVGMSSTVN